MLRSTSTILQRSTMDARGPYVPCFSRGDMNTRHLRLVPSLRRARPVSTNSKSSNLLPDSVASWMERMKLVRNAETDRIDVSRVRQLLYTLPNRQDAVEDNDLRASAQQPLSLGYHLILFPPVIPESQLNSDGTDPTYNSPHPFTRRMWAGGSFEFDPQHTIKIGEDVSCETTVSSVDQKYAGDEPMIFVNQLRRIRNAEGHTAITERRTHVFLRPPEGGVHLTRSPAFSLG